MRRWAVVGVLGLVAAIAAGFVLTYVLRMRRSADHLGCANHLREIGLFAAHHAEPRPDAGEKFPTEIPAATIPLAAYRPDERLSWFPRVLPGVDQKRQNTEAALGGLKLLEPFAADANQQVARFRLRIALCPANVPPTDPATPSPTCYVGITGLGPDSGALVLPDPPAPVPPRAGCFRYDRPTPFAAITDGLSQSLMLGERSGDLGPWLRGGAATARGLDDRPDAPPLFGLGAQFGGNHATGANWCYADGAVRFHTSRIDPRVLYGLATIAGWEADPLPGD